MRFTPVEQALLDAASHVHRQQFAGKHEQDRADAVEWLRKWSPLVDRIRRKAEKQRNDSAKEKA
jgi:hypothetical protein